MSRKELNRFAHKIRVLFKDRDIVGLTGLDEKWYATVRDNHPRGLNFEPAAVHGGRPSLATLSVSRSRCLHQPP